MELSDREYTLLMSAVSACTTASEAARTSVENLARSVAERYLTRQEDDQRDQDIRDELYRWAREQFTAEQNRANDTHVSINKRIDDVIRKYDGLASTTVVNVLMWLVGLETLGIFGLIAVVVAKAQ